MSAVGLRGTSPLPARYAEPWREAFDVRVRPSLVSGVRVLDVGSGRRPTIPVDQRPAGASYAGLDLSMAELEKAPTGAYDELHVADVVQRLPELEGRFDLVVSWQVLEHVKPLAAALENLHAYLRPGGRMVVQFSGTFSAFGLINMVVPQRLGVLAMRRLLNRDPETVFPAHYDHCWHGAIEKLLDGWSSWEIVPRYRGASYFSFTRLTHSVYLRYEQWACTHGHRNLATHYVVAAIR